MSTRRRHRSLITTAAVLLALALAAAGCSSARSGGGAPDPSGQSTAGGQALPAVGQPAPDGGFTTAAGKPGSVAALRGHPTLLWFVATWCSSCQAGTQVVAQNIARLQAQGVRVVELKLYRNLGGPNTGPEADMTSFAHHYAGTAAANPNWTFGTASQQLTRRYDPRGYLDIYYLLDTGGHIRYANGSPASTMPDLLQHVTALQPGGR